MHISAGRTIAIKVLSHEASKDMISLTQHYLKEANCCNLKQGIQKDLSKNDIFLKLIKIT